MGPDFAGQLRRQALIEANILRLIGPLIFDELRTELDALGAASHFDQQAGPVFDILRLDWSTLVPSQRLNDILGNPPFIGKPHQSPEQKADLQTV